MTKCENTRHIEALLNCGDVKSAEEHKHFYQTSKSEVAVVVHVLNP